MNLKRSVCVSQKSDQANLTRQTSSYKVHFPDSVWCGCTSPLSCYTALQLLNQSWDEEVSFCNWYTAATQRQSLLTRNPSTCKSLIGVRNVLDF